MKNGDVFGKRDLTSIARLQDGRLVVAGSNGTVAISADGGFNWHRGRMDRERPWSDILRIRQAASGVVYALGIGDLYASNDGGESWRALPRSYDIQVDNPFPASDLALSFDGNALLATSCDYNTKSDAASSGLHRSVDGGLTWKCLHFDGDAAFGTVAELHDGTILVDNRSGLERFDGRQRQSSYPQYVSDIVVEGEYVWIAAHSGILSSTDSGASWSEVINVNRSIDRFAVAGDAVCAIAGVDVFISSDRGSTWRTHKVPRPLRAVTLSADVAVGVGPEGAIERIPLR
jgi:photosystem II stability/assembly factor-like uncharacterized protein